MRNEDNYSSGFDFCKSYLSADEYVVWQGRPEKGIKFSPSDAVTTLFSIFWLSFSVFWEYTAIKSGQSVLLALWGLPFVAIGIYLLFGRFIQKIISDKNTYYVITNKRIIIKQGRKIKFYEADDLPPMDITIHKNGNGTISFNEMYYSGRYRTVRRIELKNISDITGAQEAVNSMGSENSQINYDNSSPYYNYSEVQSEINNSRQSKIIPIIIFAVMVVMIVIFVLNFTGVFNKDTQPENNSNVATYQTDFRDVISILKQRGYETDNIPTTYGYMDGTHLSNVASGIKGESKFEFYEYEQDGSPDGVYDTIVFGYSQNMTEEERVNHEAVLDDNGKQFTVVQDGLLIIVAYKNNTVVYAQAFENDTEICDIMSEIGYV